MEALDVIMAKKKPDDLKLGAVKVERDIISKAKLIAADQGKPLASYLSDSLRPIVEKDWAKVLLKADTGK
jgi:hypothetical protein